MDGVECVLPGLPCLVRLWLSVPLWVVVGKLFVEEEVGRGKWRKPVVDDCSAGTLVFLMRFLHRHDKLGDAGVAGPVARSSSMRLTTSVTSRPLIFWRNG